MPRTPRVVSRRRASGAMDSDYSFRGLGRVVFQQTRIQKKTALLEGDGPPVDGATVAPGEPRE